MKIFMTVTFIIQLTLTNSIIESMITTDSQGTLHNAKTAYINSRD